MMIDRKRWIEYKRKQNKTNEIKNERTEEIDGVTERLAEREYKKTLEDNGNRDR